MTNPLARRALLACKRAQEDVATRRHAHDSDIAGRYLAKAQPGDEKYQDTVALPIMTAVDSMPAPFRALVHDFGYVDVYRAWRKGWTALTIRREAEKNGGVFSLGV